MGFDAAGMVWSVVWLTRTIGRSGSAWVNFWTWAKNPGSGFDTPQSSDVAIMSAGRSSDRRMPPARTVWFPAIPTQSGSSRLPCVR